MPKVKRPVAGRSKPADARPKAKKRPKPAKSAKPAKASRPKPKATKRRARARTRAKPTAIAPLAVVRYDLVCTIDRRLDTNLTFGRAQLMARKHNEANPGHDAAPIRQLQ